MKTYTNIVTIGCAIILSYFLGTMIYKCSLGQEISLENVEVSVKKMDEEENHLVRERYIIENKEVLKEDLRKIVFDNMTMEELTMKLDRYLKNELAGKGTVYATHSIALGLDPYLAIAVSMHETGCKWNCSYLMRVCNNVGGQKGSPSCNGGAYRSYPSLDEGIIGFMDNLYYNYVAKGLTTPEQINRKYAADPLWASKINKYIAEIKNA